MVFNDHVYRVKCPLYRYTHKFSYLPTPLKMVEEKMDSSRSFQFAFASFFAIWNDKRRIKYEIVGNISSRRKTLKITCRISHVTSPKRMFYLFFIFFLTSLHFVEFQMVIVKNVPSHSFSVYKLRWSGGILCFVARLRRGLSLKCDRDCKISLAGLRTKITTHPG